MSRNLIRKPELRRRTGLSDTTIWRLEKRGDFPRRVVITEGGLVGWVETEVDRWVHDRVRGIGKRPPKARRAARAMHPPIPRARGPPPLIFKANLVLNPS